MKEQVVRAGKYFSVGILCIACLPVLVPLLFLVSIFGFTFVLPLGCALAGFLYLCKYVGMLYRKLPTTIVSGCSSWGRRGPSPTLFLDLPLGDLHAIESFEAVDPEFDAVDLSRASLEAQRESIEGSNDTDVKSGLGAVSFADVSADDPIEGVRIDAHTFVQDGTGVGPEDDDTYVGSGTEREVNDDVTSEENDTVRAVEKDDLSPEDGTRKERTDESTCNEDGTRSEGIDEEIAIEDEVRGEGSEDDTSPEGGTRREGKASTSLENGTTREGEFACEQIEGGEGGTVFAEKGELSDVGTTTQLPIEETGIWSDVRDDDGHVVGKEAETAVDERGQLQDVGRSKEFSGEEPDRESNHLTSVHEDSPDSGNCGVHASGGENLAAADSADDSSSRTPIVDEGKQELEENPSEDSLGGAADNDDNNVTVVDRVTEGGCRAQEEEVENLNEQKTEKNDIVTTSRDDGSHALLSVVNHEKPFRPDTHHEVNERQEGEDKGVDNESLEETKEQKIEAVTDEWVSRELGEDQETKSVSSTALPKTPVASRDASEAGPSKRDGVGHLLLHQANENDIWICKECGWKYPNAKPSAKIRRNHKKHCTGSPRRGPAPDDGMLTERVSQRSEGVAKLGTDSRCSSPLANSSLEQIEKGEMEQTSNTNSGRESGRFAMVVNSDDQITEHPTRGADLLTIPLEKRSSSTINSHFDSGSIPEHPSAALAEEERIQSSPSQPQDEGISSDCVHHSKRVSFNDGAGLAVSSPQSGGRDVESGVESESFRSESFHSAPDEFPDKWASFHSVESNCDSDQDQLEQGQQEQQLSDDVNAVKGIVGDKNVSTGALVTDIEELSEFLGIDLPARRADVPEIEWAKLATEVMKVVVGID